MGMWNGQNGWRESVVWSWIAPGLVVVITLQFVQILNYNAVHLKLITFFFFLKNHLEGLLTQRLLSSITRVSASVGLGWEPRNYISNKFLCYADAFGSGPHFEHGFCRPSYLHIFCADCSVEWIWCTNNATPGQNKTKFSLFCCTFILNNIYSLFWWQDLSSFPKRDLSGITIKCNFWTCLDDELNKLTI